MKAAQEGHRLARREIRRGNARFRSVLREMGERWLLGRPSFFFAITAGFDPSFLPESDR
jgi:hypothetical protein